MTTGRRPVTELVLPTGSRQGFRPLETSPLLCQQAATAGMAELWPSSPASSPGITAAIVSLLPHLNYNKLLSTLSTLLIILQKVLAFPITFWATVTWNTVSHHSSRQQLLLSTATRPLPCPLLQPAATSRHHFLQDKAAFQPLQEQTGTGLSEESLAGAQSHQIHLTSHTWGGGGWGLEGVKIWLEPAYLGHFTEIQQHEFFFWL